MNVEKNDTIVLLPSGISFYNFERVLINGIKNAVTDLINYKMNKHVFKDKNYTENKIFFSLVQC